MNRRERDSFTATTDQDNLAYGESACLETPPELFAALHAEFKFDIDLTANKENHLLPLWLGPGSSLANGMDALTSLWYWGAMPNPDVWEGKVPLRLQPTKAGFSNPPYGAFVPKILAKAVEEQRRGFLSVFLLPVRINRCFKDLVMTHASEVRFVDERIKFWYHKQPKLNPANGKHEGALFDSMIVVFRPRTPGKLHYGPQLSVWHWSAERRAQLTAGVRV